MFNYKLHFTRLSISTPPKKTWGARLLSFSFFSFILFHVSIILLLLFFFFILFICVFTFFHSCYYCLPTNHFSLIKLFCLLSQFPFVFLIWKIRLHSIFFFSLWGLKKIFYLFQNCSLLNFLIKIIFLFILLWGFIFLV